MPKKNNKSGRPTKLNNQIIKKLQKAFKVWANITQACLYAWISTQTYYNRCEKDKDFSNKMEQFMNIPIMFAKSKVFEAMNSNDPKISAKYALEYLKRNDPERSDKKDNMKDHHRFTSITIEDATTNQESS